jgi:uncharacterized protein (DUF983 family)
LRIYNRYLLFLILATCLIDVSLAFAKQTDIAVYFTINVIAYLIITILFIYFSPKTRRTLSFVSITFLAGFMVVVILKVMEVLHLK